MLLLFQGQNTTDPFGYEYYLSDHLYISTLKRTFIVAEDIIDNVVEDIVDQYFIKDE